MPGKRRAIHPSMRRRSRSDGQSFLPLWGGADARAAFVGSRAKSCFSVIWIVQGNEHRIRVLSVCFGCVCSHWLPRAFDVRKAVEGCRRAIC